MQNETWKDIEGYEHLYQISSFGRVFDKRTKQIKKTQIEKLGGYERVSLTDDKKKQSRFSVHRLVAQHFIPNPKNKPHVHHRDEVRTNNAKENLEWVTAKENSEARSENSKKRFRETYKRNKQCRDKKD